MSSLTRCCICLAALRAPIHMLPCLHSSCHSCLHSLVAMSEGESASPRCPLCQTPFLLDADVLSGAGSTTTSTDTATSEIGAIDSNVTVVLCQGCDENREVDFCKECSMFLCATCKKPHLRSKVTAHHQFVSIAETLSSPDTRCCCCETHRDECQISFCSECAVNHHVDHDIKKIAETARAIREEIAVLAQKAKDGCDGTQAEQAEAKVHVMAAEMIEAAKTWAVDLVGEVHAAKLQKQKDLGVQRQELKLLQTTIRTSTTFIEDLLKKGTETEVVANREQLIARFGTLERQRKEANLQPATEPIIQVVGVAEALNAVRAALQGAGSRVASL